MEKKGETCTSPRLKAAVDASFRKRGLYHSGGHDLVGKKLRLVLYKVLRIPFVGGSPYALLIFRIVSLLRVTAARV